jgi:hypothetical protein
VEGEGLETPRVEPAVQEVDDLALSRGLDAGDDHDDREVRGLELDLHPDQGGPYRGQAGLVGLLRNPTVVSRFCHGGVAA